MAGGKLSPRQKMINMMYLVLTALLALNVSREVVDAFEIVEDGMKESIEIVEERVSLIDKSFQGKLDKDESAPGLYQAAQEVSQEIDNLVAYIDEARKNIAYVDGVEGEDNMTGKDDINVTTQYFIEQEGSKRGKELQQKINDTRDRIIQIYSEVEGMEQSQVDDLKATLSLSAEDSDEYGADNPKRFWYYRRFYGVPVAAATTILTDLENRARSAEANVNGRLFKRLGDIKYQFDKLTAQVNANSNYIAAGGKYEAKIMISAGSSQLNGKVFYGTLDKDKFEKDSVGIWLPFTGKESDLPLTGNIQEEEMSGGIAVKEAGGSPGSYSYSGVIRVPKPGSSDLFDYYPFEADYKIAGDAASSIAATKMNVLYRGLPNPIQIAVGGATPGSVSASITSGSMSPKGNGEYIVTPGTANEATINASGKNSSGTTVSASQKFRVLDVPDPTITVGGALKGGTVPASQLKTYGAVICKLDNFVFDGVKFKTKGFEFILSNNGQVYRTQVNGPSFNGQAKAYLDQASSGDLVVLDRVIAEGPDGKRRNLGSITFTIQ